MRKLIAGIALFGLLGTAQPGQTQDYPARMMIAPHVRPAAEDSARIVVERTRETLGQVVSGTAAAAGVAGPHARRARRPGRFTIAAGDQTSFRSAAPSSGSLRRVGTSNQSRCCRPARPRSSPESNSPKNSAT
jgi:hypothetical protein